MQIQAQALPTIDKDEICRGCQGTGSFRGYSRYTGNFGGRCAACGGSGRVKPATAQKRAAARYDRTAQRRAEFTAKYPELVAWLEAGNQSWALSKLNTYGNLFDNQVTDLLRKMTEPAKAKCTVAWTQGRQEVEGTIVGAKEGESSFGFYVGLTLELEDGRRVWFKRPSSLEAYEHWTPEQKWDGHAAVAVGDRVKVTLTINVSDKDLSFAFGKRPYAASVTVRKVQA